MASERVLGALPPLLQHYFSALDGLDAADPQAFADLAPIARELEWLHALAAQELRAHPNSALSERFRELSQSHGQLPEIARVRSVPRTTREIIGPWPPKSGPRDARLEQLSVIVGAWPPNPGGASRTCPHCGKQI